MGFFKNKTTEPEGQNIEAMEDRIAAKVFQMLIDNNMIPDLPDVTATIEEAAKKAAQETANELKRAALLRRRDDWAYSRMNRRLYAYYTNGEQDEEVSAALEAHRNDDYFVVIPMRYKRRMDVKQIEAELNVPGQIITRETKRIVLSLFDNMEEWD